MDQDATWYVAHSSGLTVLDGDPDPVPQKGGTAPKLYFISDVMSQMK